MNRVAVVALALAACRGGGGGRPHREGSAAPVVVVNQPQLPDAGGAKQGAVSDEIEPNDSDDVATPIAVGSKMRGKIEPETDVDHYRIDIEQPGALHVMLSGVDGQDLVLEIEDGTGAVVAKSDRTGLRTKEGVPNLGVTPGRYTAIVHLAPAKKPARAVKPKPKHGAPPGEIAVVPAPVYELSVQLDQPGQNAEHEPDDDRGTANDFIPGDTVTGFVGWTGDQDVWKLSTEALSANNVLDVDVSEVEGVALELEIQDGIGQTLLVRKAPRGEALAVRNLQPVVAPGGPPFHYFVLRGDRSNPETTYRLHTKPHNVDADVEREPNDTPEHPYQIPPERARVKGEWSPGDTDCYAIAPADKPRMLDITVDTPPELDLAADLIVDGKPTLKVDHPGRGAAERLGGEVGAGSRAVVCVHAGAKAPGKGGGTYTLRVEEASAASDNAP